MSEQTSTMPAGPEQEAQRSEEDLALEELRKKIHAEALKRWRLCDDYERTDRALAREDMEFAAGGEGQWPPGMASERERDGRPMLTINRLAGPIKQVINDARMGNPAIRIIPGDSTTPEEEKTAKKKAEIYEGLVRTIQNKSRAKHIFLPAYEAVVRGGFRGSWRVKTQYADDKGFDQEIALEAIPNPQAVYRDPDSKAVDHADDKYVFVCEDMSIQKFEAMYPGESPASWDADWSSAAISAWRTIETVRLAEYWWIDETEKVVLSLLETGEVVEGDAPQFQYAPDHPQFPGAVVNVVQRREVPKRRVMRALMTINSVLEGPDVFPGEDIPIVSVEGPTQWVGNQKRHWSLIRDAKGPQQAYNFWITSIAERIALTPKQPYIVTADEVRGYEDQWANANKSTDAALVYNADPNAPGRPQRQQPAAVNAAEMQQAMQAIDDIKATTGIFDRSLGNESNEKSGIAIRAVQAQGDKATLDFPDLLNMAIERTGRIIVKLIPIVYGNATRVRTMGEDGTTKTHAVNNGDPECDICSGDYDVLVQEGPSWATKQMEAAEKGMQLVQAMPQVGAIGADLIMRVQDMPYADQLADRLKKTLPPGIAEEDPAEMTPEKQAAMQQQQQMQDAQMALEARAKIAEIKQKEADAEQKEAMAEKTRVDAAAVAAQLQVTPEVVQQIVYQTLAEMMQGEQGEQQQEMQQPQPEAPEQTAEPQQQEPQPDHMATIAQALQALSQPREPVQVFVGGGKKRMTIQAPSGATYQGQLDEGDDE